MDGGGGEARQKKTAAAVGLGACLALLLFQVSSVAAGVSHTVGDATGWTLPPSPSFYSSWASKQSFSVGDFLVFNFPGATQTVGEVTKSAYDSCSAINPIIQLNNGPVNLTITSPGPHYYTSTDSGHCSVGQKFSITATSTPSTTPTAPAPKSTPAAPAPGASTTPSPKSSTPSTPSGATSPAASTPTATPPGKGTATSPSTTPSGGALTPATTPTAAPPGSKAGAPSSTSATPATSPTAASSSPESSTPMTSAATPSTEGPGASSSPSTSSGGTIHSPATSPGADSTGGKSTNSASGASAAILLPLLVVVGPYILLY